MRTALLILVCALCGCASRTANDEVRVANGLPVPPAAARTARSAVPTKAADTVVTNGYRIEFWHPVPDATRTKSYVIERRTTVDGSPSNILEFSVFFEDTNAAGFIRAGATLK